MAYDDFDVIRAQYLHYFDSHPVVLFLGQACDVDKLPPRFCDLYYSCVVTTQPSGSLTKLFDSDTRPGEIRQFNDIKEIQESRSSIFDQNHLSLVYLYGNKASKDAATMQDSLLYEPDADAVNLLNYITQRLDKTFVFVIAGYNGEDGDLPPDKLFSSIKEASVYKFCFFITPKLSDAFQKQLPQHDYYPDIDLARVFSSSLESGVPNALVNSRPVFYRGKRCMEVPFQAYREFNIYGQLLTLNELERINSGGDMQKVWFTNFINDSNFAPQWYGYSKTTIFYTERVFEAPLLKLCKDLLSLRDLYHKYKKNVIILQGDPGSSKSIELAAVAYKIFMDREYPVIYITGNNLFMKQGMPEFDALDHLLFEIENTGKSSSKTLIIWDCAAYSNVVRDADTLARGLMNRGRRFVLVCSAYRHAVPEQMPENGLKTICYDYDARSNKWLEKNNHDSYDLMYDGKHFVIQSSRKMTPDEFVEFAQKAKSFTEDDNERVNRCVAKLKKAGELDIFNCYFNLYRSLRPILSSGLSTEQKFIHRYIREKMDNITKIEAEIYESEIACQFRELGLAPIPDILVADEVSEQAEKETEFQKKYHLDDFCITIAVFSQFKMELPAVYAFRLLNPEADQVELMQITDELTYIDYHIADGRRYSFSFRNPLEAELYLTNNHISPQRQVECVLGMMDLYEKEYRECNCFPVDDLHSLENLLRYLGPNSKFPSYRDAARSMEHLGIIACFDQIIKKLKYWREELKMQDQAASLAYLEITHTREFYANWERSHNIIKKKMESVDKWERYPELYCEKSFEDRLQKLGEAAQLADCKLDELKTELQTIRSNNAFNNKCRFNLSGMAVEMVNCDYQFKRLLESYKKFREYNQLPEQNIIAWEGFSYAALCTCLQDAIQRNPADDYVYNAFFKFFLQANQKESWSEERKVLEFMKINDICEECLKYDITSYGADGYDEIGENLTRIKAITSESNITIADIESRAADKKFLDVFDSLLEHNSVAAILYVCRCELRNIGLDSVSIWEWRSQQNGATFTLDEKQRDACRKIIDFLLQYEEYIYKNRIAMKLLLMLYWMCYNGQCYDENENKPTYIAEENQWQFIYELCKSYKDCSNNNNMDSDEFIPPMIVLLQALSAYHLGNIAGAIKILHHLRENSFPNSFRMKTPYLLCDCDGKPQNFQGRITSVEPKQTNTGRISIDGWNMDIRISGGNIGQRLHSHQVMSDLKIGLGYMGYSVRGKGKKIGGKEIEAE